MLVCLFVSFMYVSLYDGEYWLFEFIGTLGQLSTQHHFAGTEHPEEVSSLPYYMEIGIYIGGTFFIIGFIAICLIFHFLNGAKKKKTLIGPPVVHKLSKRIPLHRQVTESR